MRFPELKTPLWALNCFIVLKNWLWKPTAKWDSNARRWIGRITFLLFLGLLSAGLSNRLIEFPTAHQIVAVGGVIWSFGFFAISVVTILFPPSENFYPSAVRLAGDTLLSIAFSIITFTTLYRFLGIQTAGAEVENTLFWDHLYFSIVTFATLGYGDFIPTQNSRIPAAMQALLGNLHLGMVVGAAFFTAAKKPSEQ